ncbi:MAG: GNAT family N-acetyltransferase [Gammaproteobacteria bacterium]|nr:GNAT family N-acetyltransferase [Gammaproteobacteria bacterium]
MNQLILVPLSQPDLDEIALAFKQTGWHKPKSIYEAYLKEQLSGHRSVLIARDTGKFCGYVTLKWVSDYLFFSEKNIPEIADLNVLPQYQKKGIGTKLIQACEDLARERERKVIGLGVGLIADYGSAQRLYVHLGYVPDGRGLYYKNMAVKYAEKVMVDDDLVIYLTKIL